MVNKKETEKWLYLARDEYDYAIHDLEDEDLVSFNQTCFHFQQAAEKYLKAYILASGLTFRKVHNLTELIKLCVLKNAKFNNLIDEAAILNPYYTDTRYPVHWPMNYSKEEARKARTAAEIIKNTVEESIDISK